MPELAGRRVKSTLVTDMTSTRVCEYCRRIHVLFYWRWCNV